MSKIRVLIVDDSAVVRTFLQQVIQSDETLTLVGSAPDPFVARDLILKESPDVMILDVQMPRMDGITFLKKVMENKPTRTIIFSSLTAANSPVVLKAYEAGAIDVIDKPSVETMPKLMDVANDLIEKIKIAASAKLPTNRKPVSLPSIPTEAIQSTAKTLIAIASSTGGTEALKEVLPLFPPDIPGVVIVQHMPAVFTKTFAEALDRICPFDVQEAKDGDVIRPGLALLAPGDYHMEVQTKGQQLVVRLNQSAPLHGVRPAADHLFRSAATCAKDKAIGVVLTGMGRDGAEGLFQMKSAGAWTIGQDEATSVVWGMPKAAIDKGSIQEVLPLDQIAYAVYRKLQ